MKKSTFVALMATAVVMLTGCSGSVTILEENQENAEEYNSTKQNETIAEPEDEADEDEKTITALLEENTDLKQRIEELEAAANKVESDTEEAKKLAEENEKLKKQVEELEATANKVESDAEEAKRLAEENEKLKKQVAELEAAAKQETSQKTETKTGTSVIVNSTGEKVPAIPKEQENIRVSAFYNGKDIPLEVADEANRATTINSPNFIAKGCYVTEFELIITGVTVQNVYLIDAEAGFKVVESLTYNSVDNTYCAHYTFPKGGKYSFMIQTVNGMHYYPETVVY